LTEVIVRQFRRADAPAVYAVALESWRHTYRSIFGEEFIDDFVRRNYAPEASIALLPRIAAGEMFFHVAEQGAQIVGFCNILVTEQHAELLRIYLLPSHIGRGLGSKLLQPGEAFIAAHHFRTYFCFVHQDNAIGKAFYLKNGFRHLAEKDHDDQWFMEKMLPE
jgi:ribosomal protein S18 acetylase RimI-like enzyme